MTMREKYLKNEYMPKRRKRYQIYFLVGCIGSWKKLDQGKGNLYCDWSIYWDIKGQANGRFTCSVKIPLVQQGA